MFNVNEKRPLHEKRSQSSKDIQRKGKKKKKKEEEERIREITLCPFVV